MMLTSYLFAITLLLGSTAGTPVSGGGNNKAPSLTVSSTGPAATAQHSSMGVYFLTDQTFNNFPVYAMTGGGQFIYVDNDGVWSIWKELDPEMRGIIHPENNPTPALPPIKGWRYYDFGWKDDVQLSVTKLGGGFPSGTAETCQCGMENESNEGSYDDDDYYDEYGNDYIQGGEVASPNRYPWMVRLDPIGCGGSLISNRHVLTAHHCVYSYWREPDIDRPRPLERNPGIAPNQRLVVWVGTHDITSAYSGYPVQVQAADWLKFDNAGQHDIAMLILKTPVTFSKTVQPICLPPPTNFESYARCQASPDKNLSVGLAEYRQCGMNPLRALGWGEFGPESGQHPTLKQFDPPAVYVDNGSGNFIYTLAQNISGQIHDICGGDSGGPLMYQDQESKKWTIIGIASTAPSIGDEDCSSDDGGLADWSSVSPHYKWIKSKLSEDGTATCEDDDRCPDTFDGARGSKCCGVGRGSCRKGLLCRHREGRSGPKICKKISLKKGCSRDSHCPGRWSCGPGRRCYPPRN